MGNGVENSSAQHMECRKELWEDSIVWKARGGTQVYEEESGREDIPLSLIPPTQPPPQPVTVQGVRNQEPMVHIYHIYYRVYCVMFKTLKQECQRVWGKSYFTSVLYKV